MLMPATKALPQFEAFNAYVDPFGASQTAMSLWLQSWRAGVDATLWWTERWSQALWAFSPAKPAGEAPPVPRPIVAVIDLAQAAAARSVQEAAEIAAVATEIVETVAEAAVSVSQDAISVAQHAVETVAPPDDLTRLVGIGPKLSIALAERGVTRFAHIAEWTEADLAEVDKALDLKGRAVRDAWVAQAKRFAAED
jgi:predicted flap endonuclease-1-like 5' DNA nuclease